MKRSKGSARRGANNNDVNQPLCIELQELVEKVRQLATHRILRLPQVQEKTGRARPTVWKDVSNGTMPPPIRLGPRAVGWKEAEIDAWISARAFASRSPTPVNMKAFVASLIGASLPTERNGNEK